MKTKDKNRHKLLNKNYLTAEANCTICGRVKCIQKKAGVRLQWVCPTRIKKDKFKSRYGLDLHTTEIINLKQEIKCGICDCIMTKINLDHCHKSNKIRGVLCFSCNIALGHFKDSIEILQKAIIYLQKSSPPNF